VDSCGSQETSSSVGRATDCSRGSRGSLEEGSSTTSPGDVHIEF
jgi:hypothetical protein